jgi:hypothetical protein
MGCIIQASVRASSDQNWGGRHGLQWHHHARYVRGCRCREQLCQKLKCNLHCQVLLLLEVGCGGLA